MVTDSATKVSRHDVARAAGVSPATVSLVVRNRPVVKATTRVRVLRAIEELGYQPNAAAAALRSARSRTIAYAVPRPMSDIAVADVDVDVFRNRVLSGITRRAKQAGHFVLFDIFDDVRECIALMASRRIDGMLVDWCIEDADLSRLAMAGLPLVLLGRDPGDLPVSWIKADEDGGAYNATRHLLALGHRRIGLLTGGINGHPIGDERVRGYFRAMAEMDLTPDPRYVVHGDWTFASGYRCGQQLLSQEPRPTALFVLSEVMVAGVLKATRRLGFYVPDDLAIVTAEDSAWVEYVWPELTAVHVPMEELGVKATALLLARLDDPERPHDRVVMPTRFVVRESSASARVIQARLRSAEPPSGGVGPVPAEPTE